MKVNKHQWRQIIRKKQSISRKGFLLQWLIITSILVLFTTLLIYRGNSLNIANHLKNRLKARALLAKAVNENNSQEVKRIKAFEVRSGNIVHRKIIMTTNGVSEILNVATAVTTAKRQSQEDGKAQNWKAELVKQLRERRKIAEINLTGLNEISRSIIRELCKSNSIQCTGSTVTADALSQREQETNRAVSGTMKNLTMMKYAG